MFDLDAEVTAWSAAVYAGRCQPSASVAELTDHLYCEIDRARTAGVSDEEAFRTAVARLGSPSDLAAEHAKNRSALGTACQVATRLEATVSGQVQSREHRWLLLAHALVWAALMIASSLVLKKTGAAAISGWLLITIYIPLWWSSEHLLRRALRQRPANGA